MFRLQSKHIDEEEVLISRTDSPEKDYDDLKEVGIMVIGAPGVGKSHSVSTISFFINHENLGSVLSTSYTGVATLQVTACYFIKALSSLSFIFLFFISYHRHAQLNAGYLTFLVVTPRKLYQN
jgi:hypothetical protein